MNARILIVDADTELTRTLTHHLQHNAFHVTVANDGETGLKKALNQPTDLIVMTLTLPKRHGFSLLKAIRAHTDIPILILTERMDDLDRLLAFEMGADDYLTKPCSTIECLARLRAMLNRAYVKKNTRASITEETIHLDCAKRIAYRANEQLPLTNTEFNILEMLIKFPGQAFSKEELTEYALGRKHTAYDRSIDVHISNLRHKLGLNLNQEPWIKTVRGFGYLFNAPQK